jgi:hypothetical protein
MKGELMHFDKKTAVLFIIPIVIAVLFMIFVPRDPLTSDGKEYDVMAKNILSGKGYSLDGVTPYGFRPPLYTIFIAIVYGVTGSNPFIVVLIQIILLSFVPLIIRECLILGGIAPSQAYYGALASAVYPFGYIYAQQFVTESLTTFLFASACYFALNVWKREDIGFGKLTFYSVLITLPALSKSQHLSLVCGLGLALIIRAFVTKQKISILAKILVPIMLGAVIVLAPWGIRNYHHFGHPAILGEGAFGEGALKGYYQSKGKYLMYPYWNTEYSGHLESWKEWQTKMDKASDEALKSGKNLGSIKKELLMEEMEKNPGETLRGYIVRVYSLWLMLPSEAGKKAVFTVLLIEIFLLFASLWGMVVFRKFIIVHLAPIYTGILAESLLLPLILTEGRYSISMKPFIIMFAGLLLYVIIDMYVFKNKNGK